MRHTIAELVAILSMDATKFKQGIQSAELTTTKMVQNLEHIGRRATMMVSLPILGIGVAVTKMAMDFETQMTNIFTLMDEATIHSRDWKKEVLDLSKKVPQSTNVLSKGLYDIVSAGIDAGDAMYVLEVASKAATAGVSDAATSVKGLTTILNAYGMDAREVDRVSDMLFTTIRYGVVTFDELSPAIGKIAGIAASANISIEELGAAIAVLTKGGLTADMAVTALKGTITAFLSPTEQAKDAAKELGINLSAAELSTKGLQGTLAEISKALNISTDEMIALGETGLSDAEMFDVLAIKSGLTAEKIAEIFPNVRALIGAMILLKGENFAEELERQAEAAGAAEEAFAKMAETTKFQFDLAISSLKAAGIEIGTKLLPLATRLFKAIGELADKWGELSDATQDATLKFAGIAALIPILIWSGTKVYGIITKITTAFTLVAGAAGLASSQLMALLLLVPAFAKQISNATVAIANWITGVDSGYKAAREFMDIMSPVKWAQIMNSWTLGLLGVKEASDEVVDVEAELTDKIDENVKKILEWQYANKDLIGVLDELTTAQALGRISLEDYDKAVQFLIDSEGMYKGTAEEVLETIGALTKEHYDVKEAIEQVEQAMSTEGKTAEELHRMLEDGIITQEQYAEALQKIEGAAKGAAISINELFDSMFKLYNLNQSTIEAAWTYEEELKKLEDMQKTHTKTLGGSEEQILANINAQENLVKAQENYNTVLSETPDDQKKVLEATIALKNAQKEADETAKNAIVTTKTYTASQEDLTKQIFKTQDAREIYMLKIAEELQAEDLSIEKKEELMGKFLELGEIAISTEETTVSQWWNTTREMGLVSEEIGKFLIKMGQEAVDNGEISQEQFRKMLDEFNISAEGIDKEIRTIIIPGYDLMYLVGDKIAKQEIKPKIEADTAIALDRLRMLGEKLDKLDGRTISVFANASGSAAGLLKPAMGGIITASGLKMIAGGVIGQMPKAAYGYVVPQRGREVPVIAHEGEVFLNTSQQYNLAEWIMDKASTRSEKIVEDEFKTIKPIQIPITVELDGEIIYKKTAKYLYSMTQENLIGKGRK